jgi:cytochrome P450
VAAFFNLTPALQRDFGPGSPWRAFTRARAKADEQIYALIARRRREANANANANANAKERTDVLSLLLAARDEQGEPMSDQELRDELVTLLLAGHETTAVTLCWLLEELLTRPEIVAELRDEVRSVTGGAPLAATDVPRLRLVDSAIKEVMRLRPVVPAVGRQLKVGARIAGYDLPAGVVLVPAIHLTHRLPDLYPAPLTFRLDRFLDKKVDPYAWFPFGGGVRRCLGMAFALQELKVVTAALLAKHQLRLARPPGNRPRTVLRSVTFAPQGNTPVIVE